MPAEAAADRRREWRFKRLVAASSAATATATAAAFHRFVHAKGAATQISAVQCLHRRLGAALVHLDESEAARTSSLAIGDHVDRFHGSVCLEQVPEIVLGRLKGNVANVQFLAQLVFLDAPDSIP